MKDQDVITLLGELHDHIEAPHVRGDVDVLRGQRLVRRRRALSIAAAAAVLVIIGGAWALLPGQRADVAPAPAPGPTAPTRASESPRDDGATFRAQVRATLAEVPGWNVADEQLVNVQPCDRTWSSAASGYGGGGFGVRTNGEAGKVWAATVGFASAAETSESVDRLVDDVAQCGGATSEVVAIEGTRAVVVSSGGGVMWVQQHGTTLAILVAATGDGLPPRDVQVEIADLLSAHLER